MALAAVWLYPVFPRATIRQSSKLVVVLYPCATPELISIFEIVSSPPATVPTGEFTSSHLLLFTSSPGKSSKKSHTPSPSLAEPALELL